MTQSSSNKTGHEKQKFGIQSLVLLLLKGLFRTFFSFQENFVFGDGLLLEEDWFDLTKSTFQKEQGGGEGGGGGMGGGNCRYLLACEQALYYRSAARGLGRER